MIVEQTESYECEECGHSGTKEVVVDKRVGRVKENNCEECGTKFEI